MLSAIDKQRPKSNKQPAKKTSARNQLASQVDVYANAASTFVVDNDIQTNESFLQFPTTVKQPIRDYSVILFFF